MYFYYFCMRMLSYRTQMSILGYMEEHESHESHE